MLRLGEDDMAYEIQGHPGAEQLLKNEQCNKEHICQVGKQLSITQHTCSNEIKYTYNA